MIMDNDARRGYAAKRLVRLKNKLSVLDPINKKAIASTKQAIKRWEKEFPELKDTDNG